jgi:hypothetical protein|tara:strand:- start:172 stop:399 length:228 start_codon:yes stop_codon:yes gene_type:complete
MAEKKVTKKTTVKSKKISKSTKVKSTKLTKKKIKNEPIGDGGIVIVDDDIVIDQDKINEERRAYLEEARSQEAVD